MNWQRPRTPRDETGGVIYFPRLCDKIRIHAAGRLHPEYQSNLGSAMDQWTCEYLGVDYEALRERVLGGMSDEDVLLWARATGTPRTSLDLGWWTSFMRNRGFRDDLAGRLEQRKAESGFSDRHDILTFMDFLEADDLRMEENYQE